MLGIFKRKRIQHAVFERGSHPDLEFSLYKQLTPYYENKEKAESRRKHIYRHTHRDKELIILSREL